MLEGVRVLELTSDIAGPYCTKVLADAGADVVKVEPPDGDPLRRWGSGALFEFLNGSKRSIQADPADLEAVADIVALADIVVADVSVDPERLWASNRPLVITTITPFGCDGPWADHPSTEFTLQAACGSTGQRGLPEQPPLSAGGRIGEWMTGTYAALGTIAAYREAVRCGIGEHVDVAMLDCMAVTMIPYTSVFASFYGWPAQRGTGRTIEVPSIEPTKDGYFVVTTNSAQQFQDFLVMIGRPDLLADPDLPNVVKRFGRRDEFLSIVREHTSQRTTAEILEEAALLRIPVAPVLDGSTMPGFEHFVARGVFEKSPSGRFVQPRVPYRISGTTPRPFAAAPDVGEHTGTLNWSVEKTRAGHSTLGGLASGEAASSGTAGSSGTAWRPPLDSVRVMDCTAWWAGPAATNVLACLGADVIKVESVTRPDQMRYTSTRPPSQDRWWEWGPLFHSVNVGKRGVTLDLTRPEGIEIFERMLETSDVLVENYTPRVMEQFGLGWDRLHEVNPDLIMVRIPAFGLDGPWRDRTGFAQTMEGLAGMAWLTGFAEGPPVLVRGACDPLAGMHAVIATLLAIIERDQSGGGRLVEAALVESVLNAVAEQIVEYGATGTVLRRDGNRGPVSAPQGVYPCTGEDRWVAIAIATDTQWQALCSVLGKPPWSCDPRFENAEGRRIEHDRIDLELAAWTGARDADETASLLIAAGVPASTVVPASDIIANPQMRSRRLFEVEHHEVTGEHEIPMLPFRYSRIERWLRSAAPTLGEHNDEVLAEIGVEPALIAELRTSGIVGERPQGL